MKHYSCILTTFVRAADRNLFRFILFLMCHLLFFYIILFLSKRKHLVWILSIWKPKAGNHTPQWSTALILVELIVTSGSSRFLMNHIAVKLFFSLCIISVFKCLLLFSMTTRMCLSDLLFYFTRAPIMHLDVLVLVIYGNVNTFYSFIFFYVVLCKISHSFR